MAGRPSDQGNAIFGLGIWPASLVRLIWSSESSGHESSATCDLRRRCEGTSSDICVPRCVGGQDETPLWHKAPWTLSGARQSSDAGLSRDASRRGSNHGYAGFAPDPLQHTSSLAHSVSLDGVISPWESSRVECYHIFKAQNPNSTNFTCFRWSNEHRVWSSALPITVGRQTVSLPVCFLGSFMIFHSDDAKRPSVSQSFNWNDVAENCLRTWLLLHVVGALTPCATTSMTHNRTNKAAQLPKNRGQQLHGGCRGPVLFVVTCF